MPPKNAEMIDAEEDPEMLEPAASPTSDLGAVRKRLSEIDDVRDRLLAAGYACFDLQGVDRTTVEQLCDVASVSRPTFYRYFSDKRDLLEHIQEIESVKVRAEVRRRIGHNHKDFEALLVKTLFLVERSTRRNKYVSGFLFSREATTKSFTRGSSNYSLQHQWWGPFIERELARGDIAGDLNLEEVVIWLNASMVQLMLMRDQQLSGEELQHFIRRFLVRPLLPRSSD